MAGLFVGEGKYIDYNSVSGDVNYFEWDGVVWKSEEFQKDEWETKLKEVIKELGIYVDHGWGRCAFVDKLLGAGDE